MVAGRYLRARRKEAFISVIASLTMVGVAIGVATLIVVMSVMNGFRAELLTKILGLNGHFTAFPIEREFTDYRETIASLEQIDGVRFAVYFVEGQVLASGKGSSTGVTVRGMDEENLKKLDLLYKANIEGGWDEWDDRQGHRHRLSPGADAGRVAGRPSADHQPRRGNDAIRQHAADQVLPGQRHLRSWHGRVR